VNYEDCNGCSLCVIGCEAFQQTRNEEYTAQARNFFLRSLGDKKKLAENLSHCVESGYCTAVCPRGVDNASLFKRLMREVEVDKHQVFADHWQRSQNLYGTALKLEGIGNTFILGGEESRLHVGCTFLHSHFYRLPLLKKICEKYALPLYISEEEKCCSRFLYAQDDKDGVMDVDEIHLDASCASTAAVSFWDLLFQQNVSQFPDLKEYRLYVSVRWLNVQTKKRVLLLREFVKQTGITPVNQDGLFLATGGVASDWASRLHLPTPLQNNIPKGAVVMEVSEISDNNPWVLDFL